jgi:hypothetical protein
VTHQLLPASHPAARPMRPSFHEREFFEVVDGAAIAEPPRIQF